MATKRINTAEEFKQDPRWTAYLRTEDDINFKDNPVFPHSEILKRSNTDEKVIGRAHEDALKERDARNKAEFYGTSDPEEQYNLEHFRTVPESK